MHTRRDRVPPHAARGTRHRFFRQELTNFMYNVWATIVLLGRIFFVKGFSLGSKRITWCSRGKGMVRPHGGWVLRQRHTALPRSIGTIDACLSLLSSVPRDHFRGPRLPGRLG